MRRGLSKEDIELLLTVRVILYNNEDQGGWGRSPMLGNGVERLYCRRPILCLASSNMLTPHPPHGPASVVRGEDTLAGWRERCMGGGVNILEDARHSSVLYICKYFVGNGIAPWRSRFICFYMFPSSLIWCTSVSHK